MHTRASSVARVISARVMSRSRLSRDSLAISFPIAPEMLNHLYANTGSLRTPSPLDIHAPEEGLRKGVTLVGGQLKPTHGLRVVLEDTQPVDVHESEGELGIGVVPLSAAADFRNRVQVLPERPSRRLASTPAWKG